MILAKCNYEIYDKKLLIIVRVFEKWRLELEDFKFFIEVILDHKNLKYFMFSKLLNRRQARWFEFLSRFNFRIIYCLDKLNSAVDALNRQSKDFSKKRKNKFMWQQILKNENFKIFVLSIQTFNSNRAFTFDVVEFVFDLLESIISKFTTIESIFSNRIIIFDVDNSTLILEEIVKVARVTTRANVEQAVVDISKLENQDLEDQFKVACNNDARYQRVVRTIRNDHSQRIKNFSLVECNLVDDFVYYRDRRRLVLDDDELRFRLIRLAHDTSLIEHLEDVKCYEILSRNYWWKSILQVVRFFINNCHICVKTKYFRNKYNEMLKSLSMSKQRWFDIFVDFVIFLLFSNNLWNVTCKNIMIVVNRLFKNMIYESINDLILEDVVKTFYRTMLFHWELSFICIFDRDSQFVNHFWDQLCRKLNIKIKLFTIYHLETNDQIENTNDVMKQYLRTFYNYLQNDWVKWLSITNFVARNHYSKIIKCTLFFVNHDYHSRMRLKLSRKLLEKFSRIDHERRQRLKIDSHVEKMNQINQKLRAQMIWA